MQNIFTRVLIKDKDHHILVVQDRGDLWNFPGGKQEIGESPSECAKREVKEEIGLTVHALTEVHQGNFYFSDIQWTGYFYFADSVSGVPCMNELNKIKGIRFVNAAEKVNFPDELSVIYEELFKDDLILGKNTNFVEGT
ncbi:NUDIX hydrolase [Cytobacillus oceanisediminis]|uniref:NUDIX hydrolase n=1 Tax=Cytobacillus oceanisediminis TaxID=665099 RepID=UPI0023DC25DB|nr:NUDIX hydrolase [Cytobacillus oceanisediminis]MDF2038433.1 NUDIX hydrolase [Cytobacillus oceanisediminis]